MTPRYDWNDVRMPPRSDFEFICHIGACDLYEDLRDEDYMLHNPAALHHYSYLNFYRNAVNPESPVFPRPDDDMGLTPYELCLLYEYADKVPESRVIWVGEDHTGKSNAARLPQAT